MSKYKSSNQNYPDRELPNHFLYCWPRARRKGIHRDLMRLLDSLADDHGHAFASRAELAALLAVPVQRINHALALAEFSHDLRYLNAKECRRVGFPGDLAGHYDDAIGIGVQLVYRADATEAGRRWLCAQGKEV
jgi:hypothetical protein